MNEEYIKNIIDRVYSEMINLVLEGFEESEVDQIKKLYYDFLVKKYTEIIKRDSNSERNIKVMSVMEKSYWSDKSKDYKLSILIKDEFLNQLCDLSMLAYKRAVERKGSDKLTVTREEAEQSINKMNELFKKVQPFNNAIGYSYLSEGIEDFNYACGNSEEHSLRVGRTL